MKKTAVLLVFFLLSLAVQAGTLVSDGFDAEDDTKLKKIKPAVGGGDRWEIVGNKLSIIVKDGAAVRRDVPGINAAALIEIPPYEGDDLVVSVDVKPAGGRFSYVGFAESLNLLTSNNGPYLMIVTDGRSIIVRKGNENLQEHRLKGGLYTWKPGEFNRVVLSVNKSSRAYCVEVNGERLCSGELPADFSPSYAGFQFNTCEPEVTAFDNFLIEEN